MNKPLIIAAIALLALACNNSKEKSEEETKKDTVTTQTVVNTDTTKRQDIVLTRTFDAPVEKVWKAWTDPKQVEKWWGPKFYTGCQTKIDLREGGKYIFCMKAPADQGGQEMYTSGVYSKITPMEYMEFTQGLADKDGNRIDPATLNMPPDFPRDIRTTLVFKADGNKTILTATEYDWKVGQMRDYSEQGFAECLDKLEAFLKK